MDVAGLEWYFDGVDTIYRQVRHCHGQGAVRTLKLMMVEATTFYIYYSSPNLLCIA